MSKSQKSGSLQAVSRLIGFSCKWCPCLVVQSLTVADLKYNFARITIAYCER